MGKPAQALHRGIAKILRGTELAMDFGRAVLNGVSLGILDRDDLQSLDYRFYSQKNMYVSDEYNLDGLFEWERRTVHDFFPTSGVLVVLGAGGGREVIALSKQGFDVVGYECHPKLLEAGERLLKEKCSSGELRSMERDRCPELPENVNGIIIGWGSYMLIQSRKRRIELLRDLRSRVSSGCPILLSFFVRTTKEWRYRVAKRVAGPFRAILRREKVEEGDYLAPNWVHFFTKEDVEAELEAGGWKRLTFRRSPYGYAVAQAK